MSDVWDGGHCMDSAVEAVTNEEVRLCSCGTNPVDFGPATWHHLHVWGLGFANNPTPEQRAEFAEHLESTRKTLGCLSCRGHMLNHMRNHPPDFSNRSTLTIWLWNFHNAVRVRQLKEPMTWDAFRTRYLAGGCGNPPNTLSVSPTTTSSAWWYVLAGIGVGLTLAGLVFVVWRLLEARPLQKQKTRLRR